MITFYDTIDYRCRQPMQPQVAKLVINELVENTNKPHRPLTHCRTTRYIVIGTQYGYIHTTAGDVRTWRTYSGAHKAKQRYVPL